MNKRKISERITRKTNPIIVDTLFAAKKQKAWLPVASTISSSTRMYASVNLNEIDKATKEGDTVVVPGKVLGVGEMSKKIRVCALYFSASARDKIKNSKGESVSILDEIKKNPKMTGVKVIQ